MTAGEQLAAQCFPPFPPSLANQLFEHLWRTPQALQVAVKIIGSKQFERHFCTIILHQLFQRDDRRRATHNEVERRRRDKINNWIMKLSKIIPDCSQDTGKGFETQVRQFQNFTYFLQYTSVLSLWLNSCSVLLGMVRFTVVLNMELMCPSAYRVLIT